MKKVILICTLTIFASKVNAQAFEMVEKSWEIFGDDIDSAKVLAEKGYYLAQEKGDLKTMGRAMSYRAIYYDIETITDSALFLFYKAIDIQESIKDSVGLVTTYNNLGIFYFNQYQYHLAMANYKKAYELANALKDYGSAAGSLVNIGIIESYEKNGGNALNYYDEAERLYLLNGDTNLLHDIWSNKSKIYFDKKDYTKSYELILKSINANDDAKTHAGWVTERILAANILTAMKNYSLAEKYALEGLQEAEKNNIPERRQYLYEALANLYYKKEDFKKAYLYSSKYRDLRDSLVNDSKAAQIAEMETINKIEKKNAEIALLKLETERQKNIELEKNRLQTGLYSIIIAGIIGLIILIVLILLLINNLRLEKANTQLLTEKKQHTEELLVKEQLLMRESHHRIKNNLQLINSILDLQSRNIKDPLVKSVFTESKQRIQAISFAHQRLYGNDTVEKLHLKSFLHDLVQSIESSTLNNSSLIKIETVIEDIIITTEKAVPIGLIVNELLTNAIKYAFNENTSGIIKITLSKKNDLLELCIEDNGSGMKEEIQGTGFGHQLVKSLIRQLKAEYLLSLTSGVKHQLLIAIS